MSDKEVTPAAVDQVDDDITMTNTLLPGVEVVQPRASLAAWAEVGWVENKPKSTTKASNK